MSLFTIYNGTNIFYVQIFKKYYPCFMQIFPSRFDHGFHAVVQNTSAKENNESFVSNHQTSSGRKATSFMPFLT